MNAYKSKLVVFGKGAKAEEVAAATQATGVFMPIEKTAPKFEFMAVTPEMKKNSAFMGLLGRVSTRKPENISFIVERAAR